MPALSTPLLESKLQHPRPGTQFVPRQPLLARLDEGLSVPLTLLSAPAGFGKTMVVAEWAAAHAWTTAQSRIAGYGSAVPHIARVDRTNGSADGSPLVACAWLALDATDSDPLRFWMYATAALAALPLPVPKAALSDLLAQIRSPDAPPLEDVVETLLALLDDAPTLNGADLHVSLILDDYHHLRAQRIHDTVNYFISHLPAHVHVIIITRADPPLPLNRLRVNGKLFELRAADLCFGVEEAGAMLSRRTKLVLTPDAVQALVAHTDGWPAGLQLLCASLLGRSQRDVTAFVRNFTGSNRFVLDYLMEEVLQNQPEPVRDFLLRTSILQRFNAPLCDSLLDGDEDEGGDASAAAGGGEAPLNSRAILNYLERNGLFVVQLYNSPGWYRYYHLFAEALHDELDRSAPTLGVALHQRAARWYAHNGLVAEAIEHALLAQDLPHAADLLAEAGHDLLVKGDATTLFRWMDALPAAEIARRPKLAMLNGWLLILRGPLDGVQAVVEQLVAALDSESSNQDATRLPAPGEVAALRTMLVSYRWEITHALALGAEAEKLLSPDDHFSLAALHHALGLAMVLSGRAQEAIAHYRLGLANANAMGSVYMSLFPLFRLGQTYLELGALGDAEAIYRRGIQLATDHGGAHWPTLADGYMGMAALLRERNDLLGAEHFINRAMPLAPVRSVSVYASASTINARVRAALGRREEMATPLADAVRAAQEYGSPHLVEWLRACQARLEMAAGDLGAVRQWEQTQTGTWDEVGYYPEFEEITLARFYLADRRPRAALALLQVWQARAEERSRTRSLIEIAVLQAEAFWTLNQRAEAQAALCRALTLAEPEGILRIFLDEGDRLLPLLETLASSDACAARLLGTLRDGHAATAGASLSEPLDKLTPRELEILRAIARGASNQQVADTFVLTVGTVKGHVNHILSKLGAGNRTEAVARAREIGLI